MAMTACGVSLLFIGGAGTLQKMLIIEDGQLSSYGSIMALCLTLGSLLGEWLDLERHVERLGQWLKKKYPAAAGDTSFVSAFVTAYGLRGRYGHHRFHQ